MITWNGDKTTATDFARFAVEESGAKAHEMGLEEFESEAWELMTPREREACEAAVEKMTERMRKAIGWYAARERVISRR